MGALPVIVCSGQLLFATVFQASSPHPILIRSHKCNHFIVTKSEMTNNSDCEESIRQTPTEGHPVTGLTSRPQNFQGHQRQEKSEKLSQTRGTQKDRKTRSNVVSGMGS